MGMGMVDPLERDVVAKLIIPVSPVDWPSSGGPDSIPLRPG